VTLTPDISEQDHVQGPNDAPVTLVEYGDYQCSYCKRAYPIVKQVQSHFGSRLRFVFRNFPLRESHPQAVHAAEAAEAVGVQGRYWAMHDTLYENQRSLDDRSLIRYAKQLGVDEAQVAQALETDAFADRVQSDFISGIRSGVNGTPTFFINGVRHDDGWDTRSLIAAIERVERTVTATEK
jgi:protein-disulfide isomerase